MNRYIAHLQLHGAAFLVGISALLGQSLAVSAGMIVLGRAAFALLALSLFCLCLRQRPWRGVSVATAGKLLATGSALGMHWILFFVAVQTGGVAMATLGFATFPAFTALIAWLLSGLRPGHIDSLILLLVSAGLVLVTPSFDLNDSSTEGLLWGVLSGASYAAIAVANKHFSSDVGGLPACWWQCLAISLLLLPPLWRELPLVESRDWLLLMALGVFCTGLAYSLFITALKQVRTSTAAVVIAVEPVYAIAGAWLVFGSTPSGGMLLGGALILGAVAWSGLRSAS
ncbi:DMT family transporter [Stutzerimonas kirkiae]|uniref:DMT family transporter n=1 Tax=Stutzerimonas kirkiae TaxID=2211392 RepID=UPI0010383375|nr:EamA family transporter [Stutzerimonas kirkiae]TBV15360.1 EamA/RhaT family transporter [Stutzerimonas kirkiae]